MSKTTSKQPEGTGTDHTTRRIIKAKRKCHVKGCESNTTTNPDLSFHAVPPPGRDFLIITSPDQPPKAVDAREIWLQRLQSHKLFKNMRVCSLHFLPEDFILLDANIQCGIQRPHLNKCAIPSQSLPSSSSPGHN